MKKQQPHFEEEEEQQQQDHLKDLQLDQRGDGLYSGTFRWHRSKKFLSLPSFPSICPDLTQGWFRYLNTRGNSSSVQQQLVEKARKDPSLLDALSFPLSLIHTIHLLHLTNPLKHDELHIIVLGASVKVEERILFNTCYWDELGFFFSSKKIKLYFTGEEISETKSFQLRKMNIQLFKGKTNQFLKCFSFRQDNAIFIGYNTGFGNFIESNQTELLWSWLPDLYQIAATNIPAIFTCSNDYADMQGEFSIFSNAIGANFLLLPKENGFSAASHLHEPGKKMKSWSRANSFYYVIQGFDSKRQRNFHSITSLKDILECMNHEKPHLDDQLGRYLENGTILAPPFPLKKPISSTPSVRTSSYSSMIKPDFQVDQDANNQLVITVHLPGVRESSNILVDISSKSFALSVPERYSVKIDLPVEVCQESSKAAFNKKKERLKVHLQQRNPN